MNLAPRRPTAMTGWRVGYTGGPEADDQAMMNMQGPGDGRRVDDQPRPPCSPRSRARRTWSRAIASTTRDRHNLVVGWLLRRPRGITCHKPEGAFCVFPNIAGCISRRRRAAGSWRPTRISSHRAAAGRAPRRHGTGGRRLQHEPLRFHISTQPTSACAGTKRTQEFCADLR